VISSQRTGIIIFAILLVAVVIWKVLLLYTEYLWFDVLTFKSVFTTMVGTRILLGLIVGVVFFVLLYVNLRLARRLTPSDVTFIGRRLLPPAEREQIEVYADKALLILALAGGLLAGLVASGQWAIYLKFLNAVPFGDSDPIFHKDIGFYVFRLPFLKYVWGAAFAGLVVTFVATVLVYVYEETIHISSNAISAAPHVRVHLSILLASALLWKTYGYWLERFKILFSTRSTRFFGASYADVHAKLVAYDVLIVLAVICAVVVLVTVRSRSFKWPGLALGLLVAVSFLGGSVIPSAVHRVVVLPNELEKEQPFIEHNILLTNKAYGLPLKEGDAEKELHIENNLTANKIELSRPTIDNVRLWDERPLLQTYSQLQELRTYYRFAGVDVDRYMIDGKYQQVMLAARQMASPEVGWQNEKLVYTHGYGLCMSPVSEKDSEGLPKFIVRDIPVVFPKGLEVPPRYCALYYQSGDMPHGPAQPPPSPVAGMPAEGPGQGVPQPPPEPQPAGVGIGSDYIIVNTNAEELDYPLGNANKMTHYAGKGGVPIGSFGRKLLFTLRFFPDFQILLTQYINQNSRIQFHRMVEERVRNVAPFLYLDRDPYLVVANGRLKWILDAYTATRQYPYSAVSDLLPINYIRNSVKAVVDAYDGTVDLYVFDEKDPIIQCYRKIFPKLFKPRSEMPEELVKHVRYPIVLFMVQAQIYCKYHMRDPQVFYNQEDRWAIPNEIYRTQKQQMEPYYVILKTPPSRKAEFMLIIPFTPYQREDKNMIAWMAAKCDEPDYGKLLVYKFPKKELYKGPWQIEAFIDQDPEISEARTLWGQQGSQVIRGNLLVIPIHDLQNEKIASLLYIEPLYLVAEQTGVPSLEKVILAYGKKVVMRDTLDSALDAIFGTAEVSRIESGAPRPATPSAPAKPGISAQAHQLAQSAWSHLIRANEALKRGDWAAYGREQEQLKKVLSRLKDALKGVAGPAATQ